jgi:hypothetical protein
LLGLYVLLILLLFLYLRINKNKQLFGEGLIPVPEKEIRLRSTPLILSVKASDQKLYN